MSVSTLRFSVIAVHLLPMLALAQSSGPDDCRITDPHLAPADVRRTPSVLPPFTRAESSGIALAAKAETRFYRVGYAEPACRMDG
jgi:hypothetical protein